MRRGAGPAASIPSARSCATTSANRSPPGPVAIGSVTHSTAAAAMAASAALPPARKMRSPAAVAVGWLVATIALAATDGGLEHAITAQLLDLLVLDAQLVQDRVGVAAQIP